MLIFYTREEAGEFRPFVWNADFSLYTRFSESVARGDKPPILFVNGFPERYHSLLLPNDWIFGKNSPFLV